MLNVTPVYKLVSSSPRSITSATEMNGPSRATSPTAPLIHGRSEKLPPAKILPSVIPWLGSVVRRFPFIIAAFLYGVPAVIIALAATSYIYDWGTALVDQLHDYKDGVSFYPVPLSPFGFI